MGNTADGVFAGFCFVFFLIGAPGNAVALVYFLRLKQDIPTLCYRAIAATDLVTSLLVLPVGIALASDRRPVMFSNKIFCAAWGFSWELIPYFSVFLVFTLSVLRTYALLCPMKGIGRKLRLIRRMIIGYMCFLVTRQMVGVVTGLSQYKYDSGSGYCWNHISNSYYQIADAAFSFIQVFFPLVPIIGSCILSTYSIYRSLSFSSAQKSIQRGKSRAAVTIITVTVVYIMCNLPCVINYTRFLIECYITKRSYLHSEDAMSVFLRKYAWLLCYIMVVTLNSALNPLVYMARMTRFRRAVINRARPTNTIELQSGTVSRTGSGISRVELAESGEEEEERRGHSRARKDMVHTVLHKAVVHTALRQVSTGDSDSPV